MKLSELRVCDGCGGPVVHPPRINFHVIRISSAIVIPSAVNEVLDLARQLKGSLKAAETTVPDADVVKLLGDELGWDELLLCSSCYFGNSLGRLLEIVDARRMRLHEAAVPGGERAS